MTKRGGKIILEKDLERLHQRIGELEIEIEQLKKNLQQSEDRFRKVFHASSNLMTITTLKEGRMVDLNEASANIGGYKREELIGHISTEHDLFEDPKQGDMLIAKLQDEGKIHNLEVKAHTKDGDTRTLLLSADPITVNDEPCLLSVSVDITRKEKEAEALRKSEEKYRMLVENSLQGLAIMQDSSFVVFNNRFAEISGYSPEELLLLSPDKMGAMIHPDDRELIENRRRDRMAGKSVPSHYEYRGIKKDGTEIWLEIYSSLIEYNGRPAIQSAFMDVTERKRMAEALRLAEEKYRSIFEGALEGIFRSTPDGKFLAANPSLAQMLGYSSPEEFIVTIKDIGHQIFAEPEKRKEYLRELKNADMVYGFEFQALRKDGSKIWLSIYSRSVRNSAGRLLYYDGYVEDITEHKRADENLRRALDWQEAIFEGSRDAVIISDADSRFIGANKEACKLTGYSREELLKMGAWDLNRKVNPSVLDALRNRFLNGEDVLGETTIFTKDGREIDVEFGHRRVIISGESYIHSIARDITNRKRLEAQLMQAQKMEAIGVLAGGVAHDFNNLLNVINGYSELVLEGMDQDNPTRRDLEQIQKAGHRAASLTSQLLAFSRKQMLRPEVLDLNATISDMSKMLRRLIGEDIELVAVAQPGLGLINADPGQIQQVIMNLAVNARDAMPKGGKLTIETENVSLDGEYVKKHVVAKAGPYIMLAISDNGIGMDSVTQSRLFEPFFTTKEKGKGTGLGLSTVYGIVKQSNGFIWVYSEPGKGTTFKIYFPRVEGETSKYLSERKSELERRGLETVLLAEDEEWVRALASRILRERGYKVLEAINGTEALSIAREFDGSIQLVLTDVVMPEMGGRDLVSQLRALRPGIKALYISGYTDDAIVHHGILDSDVAFLQKPFSVDSLACKVREVMDA